MKTENQSQNTTAEKVAPIANINGVYVEEKTKIKWLSKDNPKRPSGKAHARFEGYFKSKTVGEYLSSGGTKADLKHDAGKKFLEFQS